MESAPVQLDITERGELYDDVNGDGKSVYQHTCVVYKLEDKCYRGTCQARLHEIPNVKLEDISDAELIPTEVYFPLVPSNFTKAPQNLPENCYVKRPSLLSFRPSESTEIADKALKEVDIWETLRVHPHPNIAEYIGC
jgi:hypothetical protein